MTVGADPRFPPRLAPGPQPAPATFERCQSVRSTFLAATSTVVVPTRMPADGAELIVPPRLTQPLHVPFV